MSILRCFVAGIKLLSIAFVLFVFAPLSAQVCEHLRDADPDRLVAFLNENAPNEDTSFCIAYAIDQLGNLHYESAIPSLARLLDFRRPATEREKRGSHIRMQFPYPAVEALAQMGKSAQSTVLEVLESTTTSPTARENAVFTWMEIYKYDRPGGIAALRQASDRAGDLSSKDKLTWAISRALTWCNPVDQSACKEAAQSSRTYR